MSITAPVLEAGQIVRVAFFGEDRAPEIGRVGYGGEWMSYVHLAGGDRIIVETSDLTPLRFQDPTGLTTGRWRVRRKVLVHNGAASVYVFRAEPIPARGVAPSIEAIVAPSRDFPRFEQAIAYANERAARNLR
ncbi:hypothetical protein [Microbacterium rhizophilus]|uniref:hypothetical protein n=1 Tax=Microbacterium rhizophilus TaxID=3138934 RepID=UPI0031EBD40A